jgi:hypothetical protein
MLCEISALACNPDNRNKLREAGACSFAVDAVVRFPYEGIRAVINLALDDEDCKTLLREAGACQKIVDAMMRFPYEGLRAIVHLTCDPDNRKKLREAGGSTWIVQLMMHFKTERGVQLQGLQAIVNLAFDGDLDLDADLKGGTACLWVVEVMTVFYKDRDIQALACTALASLALISVDNQKSMSDAEAGSKVVVAMIESFPMDAQVQENGCLAIMAMVRDLNVHKFTIKPFAGVQAIILAMHTFPHDCNIQGNGCGAISSLPKEAIDLNPHEFYDACSSLVRAMTTFRQDRRVQGNGCLALSKLVRIAVASDLSIDFDDACSFEQRFLQVTMDAIKAFPDDLGVQKKAWWTMIVMTESCAMTSELQKKECETLVKNAREAWDRQKEEEVDVFVFTNIVMVNIGLEH